MRGTSVSHWWQESEDGPSSAVKVPQSIPSDDIVYKMGTTVTTAEARRGPSTATQDSYSPSILSEDDGLLREEALDAKLTSIKWVLQTYREKIKLLEKMSSGVPMLSSNSNDDVDSLYPSSSSEAQKVDSFPFIKRSSSCATTPTGSSPIAASSTVSNKMLLLAPELQHQRIEYLERQVAERDCEIRFLKAQVLENNNLAVECDSLAATVIRVTKAAGSVSRENVKLRSQVESLKLGNSILRQRYEQYREAKNRTYRVLERFFDSLNAVAEEEMERSDF